MKLEAIIAMILSASSATSVGCSGTTVPDDATSESTSTGTVDPDAYVLDFTSSEQGGMFIGSPTNLAFAIDSSEHHRQYKMIAAGGDQLKPGLMLTNDFGGCDVGGSVEANTANLEVIDVAHVVEVRIEMLNLAHRISPLGVFCFGYRVPGEGWHWVADEPDRIPVTYDAATDRFNVRIPIAKGPIDGVKLMTDAVGKRAVTTITYVIEP